MLPGYLLAQVAAMRLETKKGFAEVVHVHSYFLVYQPTPRLPAQAYAARAQSANDLDLIFKQPYNTQFWRDNEIIRASPVEEQVISDLKGQKVFGWLCGMAGMRYFETSL